MHAEIDSILMEMDEEMISLEMMGRFNYVNAVMAETQRLSSVTPLGVPHQGDR